MVRRTMKMKYNNKNSPVVVFAHGAGAPSSSPWIIRWKNLLGDALNAAEVVTFDYPYISARKPLPKAETLVDFHSGIVKKIASKYPQHPLILVGKSMGSRVSCMVAAENGIRASTVVCLGYPLKGTNGAIRDEPLLQLTVPTMFIQGSEDVLCPLELLDSVMKKMKALNRLHVIENGDHSFKIVKNNLELSREEAEARAVEAIAMFVSEIIDKRDDDGGDWDVGGGGAWNSGYGGDWDDNGGDRDGGGGGRNSGGGGGGDWDSSGDGGDCDGCGGSGSYGCGGGHGGWWWWWMYFIPWV